ncbi:MAG: N-carbamoyl-D-amino-acid hydrolase [Chloroflexota bacterium]
MARMLNIGVAQLGPIARNEPRTQVTQRLIELLVQADERGCELVVYPELALTTFFPRWLMTNQEEVDSFFEREMPNPAVQPLFDEALKRGIGFHLGYAELSVENGTVHHYNTAILVNGQGKIVGKYRKIHLPGHAEFEPQRELQHLEKRYFEVGDLGFPVWRSFGGIVGMCICNDRRWPETYRMMGLQGVELVVLGYNTPATSPDSPEISNLQLFHNHLSMQAGAYQNGCWVAAAAKAGMEEDVEHIGGSCIISPTGQIIAQVQSVGDELITSTIDLDLGKHFTETTFNFAKHRRIEHYGLITEQIGAIPPPEEGE